MNDLDNKVEAILPTIVKNDVRWLKVSETWRSTATRTRLPIVAEARRPRPADLGRPQYGMALLTNPSLYETWANDIVIVSADSSGQYLVFNDDNVQFIALYLSPSGKGIEQYVIMISPRLFPPYTSRSLSPSCTTCGSRQPITKNTSTRWRLPLSIGSLRLPLPSWESPKGNTVRYNRSAGHRECARSRHGA